MSSKSPLSLFSPTQTRVPSQAVRNADIVGLSTLRNHLNISTWLLLGALLQIALSLLPIRKVYAVLPTLVLVTWRFVDHALVLLGWKSNPLMEGVIPRKVTGMYPGGLGPDAKPKEDTVSVVLLGARSNHPNGVFSKVFGEIAGHFKAMTKDLEDRAATNGFLGATSWLGASDRTTSSQLLTIFYFRTGEDVHAFAHSPVHREGWDFWNRLVKDNKAAQFSIMHEMYEAPKGAWENVYMNYDPTGFGTTSHPVRDENGGLHWASSLVDAKGRYRTSKGRQGKDDGAENDVYGEEPY